MSEFFDSGEESEIKKQSRNVLLNEDEEEESDDKTSHLSRKTTQLKEDIFKLEENLSNHKKIDEFVKDLPKKYKIVLKKGTPIFLHSFLEKVIAVSKTAAVKGRIKKFLEKHPLEKLAEEEDTVVVIQQPKVVNLEDQLEKDISTASTRNTARKIEELFGLIAKYESIAHKLKILIVILDARYHEKGWKAFENLHVVLCEIAKILNSHEEGQSLLFREVDLKAVFRTSLSLYLTFLVEVVEEKDIPRMEALFNLFEGFSPETVNKIRTFFVFYKKRECQETNLQEYKLSYFMRQADLQYPEVKGFYNAHKQIYNVENFFISHIVNEMGMFAFKNLDYRFAFDTLQEVYFKGSLPKNTLESTKHYLMILTIILEDAIVDEPFFDVFIENMSCLESSALLLPSSSDNKNEIYRAFFLLENGFHEDCFLILKSIVNIDDSLSHHFKKRADSRIQRQLQTLS